MCSTQDRLTPCPAALGLRLLDDMQIAFDSGIRPRRESRGRRIGTGCRVRRDAKSIVERRGAATGVRVRLQEMEFGADAILRCDGCLHRDGHLRFHGCGIDFGRHKRVCGDGAGGGVFRGHVVRDEEGTDAPKGGDLGQRLLPGPGGLVLGFVGLVGVIGVDGEEGVEERTEDGHVRGGVGDWIMDVADEVVVWCE